MEPEVDALGNWIGYDEKFELPRPEGALSSWKIFFRLLQPLRASGFGCVPDTMVSAVCLSRPFRLPHSHADHPWSEMLEKLKTMSSTT